MVKPCLDEGMSPFPTDFPNPAASAHFLASPAHLLADSARSRGDFANLSARLMARRTTGCARSGARDGFLGGDRSELHGHETGLPCGKEGVARERSKTNATRPDCRQGGREAPGLGRQEPRGRKIRRRNGTVSRTRC